MNDGLDFSSTSPPLSPDNYRDELERTVAAMIIDAYAEQHECARAEQNTLTLALRLLGGYGWTQFNTEWAHKVIAAKGQPRLGGVSWRVFPGGPLWSPTFVDRFSVVPRETTPDLQSYEVYGSVSGRTKGDYYSRKREKA